MPSPRNTVGERTIVDWSAAAALAFDWVFAVGQYVFTVLTAGFVGGYFGQFLDFFFYLFSDAWVDRGREWGWLAGAGSAAIGVPLGWVRADEKKFSLPSPRKLRRRVSNRVREGRQKRKVTEQYRRLRDVLKSGAGLGLVGGFLGLFLGFGLALCWWSIAMSPFSPEGWFESIEVVDADYDSPLHRRESPQDGVSMSSNHPLLWYALLGPVALLGSLGAVGGAGYGMLSYLRYLWTTPADARARHRQEAQQQTATWDEAQASAKRQGLPKLAPPPRGVPLRIHWQLLRERLALGLAVAAAFFVVGVVAATVILHQWLQSQAEAPLIVMTLPSIIVCFGLLSCFLCLREWRRKADVLRCGYLTRCRILRCKDERFGTWKSFDDAFDKLHRVWHKPIDPSKLNWFRMIGRIALAFTVLLASGFALGTGVAIWALRDEGWIILVPIGMLLFALALFRFVFRFLKRFATLSARPSGWDVKPVVEARYEFLLPDGKAQRADGRLNWQRELNSGVADPEAVCVYHPVFPERALLLTGFDPPLEVGPTGQWQFAAPTPRSRRQSSGVKAYVTPSGRSYHRPDCRFVEDRGSPVPIEYAQRYYDPCDACAPPQVETGDTPT